MFIGFVLWCVFHVLFLVFGLGRANYALILLFYGIRGLAYPLFLYSFIVAIIHNVRSDSSSSALGWFWAVYSVGIGVFGSYIPSFTIPHIGEMGTLWLALAFCVTGGLIALAALRNTETPRHMQNLTTREKFSELGRAVTLIYTNRSIMLSSIVRIINTLSLFGFAVVMPMMFVDELGFTTSEWLQVWAAFFFTTIFSNVFWGIVAEKLGWMKVVRWFGCIGMALSSLAFYYLPTTICRPGCRTSSHRRLRWCCCRTSAPSAWWWPIPRSICWRFVCARLFASISRALPVRQAASGKG
ncbi:MFS transporter [Klebsiella aerogenes]|nr:MFS transporter [Klebsiella aerogenes]MCL9941777.1 MFS transporter [Klebsiella aerogenes]